LGLYQIAALKGDLETVSQMDPTRFSDPADPAGIYALANLKDLAFEWIERSYKSRSVMMVSLQHYWIWDNLRDDQRFENWLLKMNIQPPPTPLLTPSFSTDAKNPSADKKPSIQIHNRAEILQSLEHAMERDELFLDPLLSLRDLAEELDLHPNKLSWLINDHFKKNFNDFINNYRLNYFQIEALKPEHKKHTLLSIAFESGFNSKSVFNDYFKKQTGLTPSRWLKHEQSQRT
jgi:AraC-like DNA-binding protein